MDEKSIRHIFGKVGVRNISRPNTAGWMHCSCPFAPWTHKNRADRSEGFAIKVETDGVSAFKCPSCKQQGRISHFVRTLGYYHKKDYGEYAMEAEMADLQGLENIPAFEDIKVLTVPVPLDDAIFDGMFEDAWAWPIARNFLEKRGISEKTVCKLGLGYDPEKKRIVFPIRGLDKKLYGHSGRTVIDHPAKVLDYEGLPKRALILGTEHWEHGKPVALVEGLFAYAHFHEIGADATHNIGAILGSYLTEEKATLLKSFDEPVYWFLDPDPAGDDGLFGKIVKQGPTAPLPDEEDEEPEGPVEEKVVRDRSSSALHMLHGHVPQFVPDYPVDDPDDLTLKQFNWMVGNAKLWLPENM